MTRGYLGIDNGTQGLSVIFTDEHLNVLATGEGVYGMVPGLDEGCYEQRTEDWDAALVDAMKKVREQMNQVADLDVLAIGISGQMHGEVLADIDGNALGPVRLWCDARNESEGKELTDALGFKMPKRSTASRFLWTIRNRPERARLTRHMTTPAGWISFRLTGQWTLGIGDASGMFPIDQKTLDYDEKLLEVFDTNLVSDEGIVPLRTLLPRVRKAGEDAGVLDAVGAELLGLPMGIPVAAAEGDQPAALAGSLIGDAGMVSMSFGTSVVSNSVGDRAFQGVSDAVDHFCAPDGKPINMVWLRNGTTFMNTVVESFADAFGQERASGFAAIMPKVVEADPDCGGLLALPFMDDEPGVNVSQGGTAMIIGWNSENSTAGNIVKAALLSTIFNLKLGSEVLEQQGYPRTEIILSGGLTKTTECGQIVADVFNNPVTLLESAEEGTAWGAALMAKFRHEKMKGSSRDWSDFLHAITTQTRHRFVPDPSAVKVYEGVYSRYKKLIELQPLLNEALKDS